MQAKNPEDLVLSRGFEMVFPPTGLGVGGAALHAIVKKGAIVESRGLRSYRIISSKPILKRGSTKYSDFGLFNKRGYGENEKWILNVLSLGEEYPTPDNWVVCRGECGKLKGRRDYPVIFRQRESQSATRKGTAFAQRPGSGLAKLPPRSSIRSPPRRKGTAFSQRPGSGLAKLPPARRKTVRSPIKTRSQTRRNKGV